MTIQAQTSLTEDLDAQNPEATHQMADNLIEQEQLYRASTYGLIAALLRSPPDNEMLLHISQLVQQDQENSDDLLMAMSTLGLSAQMLSPAAIDDEYHDLFIGLGKGQVVPYGSWYMTGFLMEKPLSDLRDDLAHLGYVRDEATAEPEDHAAALCEVMSMMIGEGVDISTQRNFFNTHMANWFGRFFDDLMDAKSAIFYKSLGRFGSAFTALETDYFSMQT